MCSWLLVSEGITGRNHPARTFMCYFGTFFFFASYRSTCGVDTPADTKDEKIFLTMSEYPTFPFPFLSDFEQVVSQKLIRPDRRGLWRYPLGRKNERVRTATSEMITSVQPSFAQTA